MASKNRKKKYVQPSAIKDINENTEVMESPSHPARMNTSNARKGEEKTRSNARGRQREDDSLDDSMFPAGGKGKPAIKEISMKVPGPITNRSSTRLCHGTSRYTSKLIGQLSVET